MIVILIVVILYVINYYEGVKIDEISYMIRGKSLLCFKFFDVIIGVKFNFLKVLILSISVIDLD